ncbi:hypothetical protein Tco_1480314, partial [Tanacetum coccineum]
NIASFSGAHESDPDLFTSTNVEDKTLGGSFHTTPPRSTQVPPEGPTSGGAEDLTTLTALSSLVSELVQKVSTLESELQAHKLLFKEVVATLVKKVKALELKLNTRSRKVVMSEFDKEVEEEQDVDPLIKLDKAAAASDAHVGVSPGADSSKSRLIFHNFRERRERPMTPSQLRQYMRTYVKNQGPAVYSTGWTMAQVRKLSPEQLQEEFDKIQRAVAFTRGLKRDGSPMSSASSKKLKTGDDEVNVEAPSHGVPQEEESATPSRNKVGTKKKRLGRKGVHTSQSTIPIEEGDPEAENKVCIKYASDTDSASDDDTPVNLYVVDKQAEGVGLVLWGDLKVLIDSPKVNDGSDVWKSQHTWSIQSWKLYSFSGVHVLETVSGLVLHMFMDKKYPLYVNLIERMLDHQLEICHGKVGNELPTAV